MPRVEIPTVLGKPSSLGEENDEDFDKEEDNSSYVSSISNSNNSEESLKDKKKPTQKIIKTKEKFLNSEFVAKKDKRKEFFNCL